MNDRPLQRKYARLERERRFLLHRLPDSIDAADFERLRDLYLANSNLRLRRIPRPNGALIQLKPDQKLALADARKNDRHRQS